MGLTPTVVASVEWEPVLYEFLKRQFPAGWALNDGTARFIGYVNLTDERPVEFDDILCVAAINRWMPGSCELTVATNQAKTRRASKTYIAHVFNTIFGDWNRTHCTAHVAADNTASLRATKGLGFKELAVLKDFRGDGLDTVLFGFTKRDWDESRWATAR